MRLWHAAFEYLASTAVGINNHQLTDRVILRYDSNGRKYSGRLAAYPTSHNQLIRLADVSALAIYSLVA
jgi:hypothetical protein